MLSAAGAGITGATATTICCRTLYIIGEGVADGIAQVQQKVARTSSTAPT